MLWDFAYFYILAKIYLLNDLTRVDPLPGDEKKSTLLEGLMEHAFVQEVFINPLGPKSDQHQFFPNNIGDYQE